MVGGMNIAMPPIYPVFNASDTLAVINQSISKRSPHSSGVNFMNMGYFIHGSILTDIVVLLAVIFLITAIISYRASVKKISTSWKRHNLKPRTCRVNYMFERESALSRYVKVIMNSAFPATGLMNPVKFINYLKERGILLTIENLEYYDRIGAMRPILRLKTTS